MSLTCRACRTPLAEPPALLLKHMPRTVQNLPRSRSEAEASAIALDVRQCEECGLVQLTNDPVPYHREVIRAGVGSPSLLARQRAALERFIRRFHLEGRSILEVGSGRGEYLSLLGEMAAHTVGMEHSEPAVQEMRRKGLHAYHAYPNEPGELEHHAPFDAAVCINFLEHAPDPVAFLRGTAALLTPDGVGMISVPDFDFELAENFVFSFMSDHLSYFSAPSLAQALHRSGLAVVELFPNPELNVITAYFRKQRAFDASAAEDRAESFSGALGRHVEELNRAGRRVAAWGASHLAFSVISQAGLGDKLAYIVDSAPYKQGRFAPATGVEIVAPERLRDQPAQAVLILCPEYSDEIARTIQKEYGDIVKSIATFLDGELRILQEDPSLPGDRDG